MSEHIVLRFFKSNLHQLSTSADKDYRGFDEIVIPKNKVLLYVYNGTPYVQCIDVADSLRAVTVKYYGELYKELTGKDPYVI